MAKLRGLTIGHVRRFIESIIGFVSVKDWINDSFIRLMGAVRKNNVFLMVVCYSKGRRGTVWIFCLFLFGFEYT